MKHLNISLFLISIVSAKPIQKKEKLSHLCFYWNDILSDSNPTMVLIAHGPTTNLSSTTFGLINMINDRLNVGPNIKSKLLGYAHGMYASISLETLSLMMVMNFAFIEGKYNGSTLTVMERNVDFEGVREMLVVDESGVFRVARGYVQARTRQEDMQTGDTYVLYDCYVMHY